MKIEDFNRLGEVLITHDYSTHEVGNTWGNSPTSAMATWLTLENYIQESGVAPKYFLFATNHKIDMFDGTKHVLGNVYYTGLDYIIDHFINRRIGIPDPIIFRAEFSKRFQQIKANYELAYSAWNSYYELGINPTTIAAPLFSDYYREHVEEFNANIITNRDGTGNTTGTGTTDNVTNAANTGTVTDTVTAKVVSTGQDKTSTISNVEGTNNGKNLTTTDMSNHTESTVTANNTGRQLTSDTPQSMVSADSSGNPESISWKYASGLQDNITKNSTTTNDTTTNSGTVNVITELTTNTDTTGTVTTDTKNDSDTTQKNTRTLDTHNDTTAKDTTTTATTFTNKDNAITSDTHRVTNRDIGYTNLQATVNAFLSSPFSVYFWDKLFNEFENLFLSIYDLENYPLYQWKIDRDGVGVIRQKEVY